MKRSLIVGFAVFLAAFVFSAARTQATSVDRMAPALAFKDIVTGKKVTLESLKGKVVVIDFWATWCAPCREEIPGYIEMQKKYGSAGLVIVGVSLDTKKASAVRKFAEENRMNYLVALGSYEDLDALTGEPGAQIVIPTTFLIDRAGKIIHQKIGMMPSAEYEELVKKAL